LSLLAVALQTVKYTVLFSLPVWASYRTACR
jgi:hypothetical protein